MDVKSNRLAMALLLAGSLMLAACSTTRLTSEWKDNSYIGGPIKSILIVGVSEDERARKIFESVFTDAFKKSGVQAVASADMLPAGQEVTKELLKSEAEKRDIQSILVTHLLGVKTKTVYNPPVWVDSPSMHYYDRFGGYYPVVYDRVYREGYYSQHRYVQLETNVYDRATEELIWTAQSETVDPSSDDETIESLCKQVMSRLNKSGLVQKAK